jgi:hypothetical protein
MIGLGEMAAGMILLSPLVAAFAGIPDWPLVTVGVLADPLDRHGAGRIALPCQEQGPRFE